MNTMRAKRNGSRGIALIITLLLLSLFTVMTLAMIIATTSDTLIDGYYNNFRGSFYAADSGINAARQYIINQFNAAIPPSWTPASGAPISAGQETTITSNLINTTSGFGSYQSTTGGQTGSWPGSFEIDTSSSNTYVSAPTCTALITSGAATNAGPYNCTSNLPTCTGASCGSFAFTLTYTYPYQITAHGQSRRNEQNTIVENGSVTVLVSATTTGTSTTSFSAYGTLLNAYNICSSPFVTGTMTGPFFSNGSWNFGDSGLVGTGKYIFTSSVGAADSKVGYMYSDGTCTQSTASSNTHKGTTIAPTFQGGLNLGQPAIPMPSDTFSQQYAVLDGYGNCSAAGVAQTCSAPTQAQMAAVLVNAAGTSWPATGSQPATGVYIPMTPISGSSCPCKFAGGGIYVQGNAKSVQLTAATASANNSPVAGVHANDALQEFQITQGSTTTTVYVDLTNPQTTIVSGSNSQTVTGVPMNNNTGTEAAMLYVNGAIGTLNPGSSGNTGLSGPASGAAIQNGSAVTVTATGVITITGSLTYNEEPDTFAASGSTPADTPIQSNITALNGAVLGIYSSGSASSGSCNTQSGTSCGDIQLAPNTNGQNMEIDASVAMIGSSSTGGLIAKWNSLNTLTIVGGRIAMQAKQGNMSTRNIWFDTRFGSNFAPPWFPATTVTTTGTNTYSWTVTPSRNSWVNTTATE